MAAPAKFRCCRIVFFIRVRLFYIFFSSFLPGFALFTVEKCVRRAVVSCIFRNQVIQRSEFHLSRIAFYDICECACFRCLEQLLTDWACFTKMDNFFFKKKKKYFFLYFFDFHEWKNFLNFFQRYKCARRRWRQRRFPCQNKMDGISSFTCLSCRYPASMYFVTAARATAATIAHHVHCSSWKTTSIFALDLFFRYMCVCVCVCALMLFGNPAAQMAFPKRMERITRKTCLMFCIFCIEIFLLPIFWCFYAHCTLNAQSYAYVYSIQFIQ